MRENATIKKAYETCIATLIKGTSYRSAITSHQGDK